VKFSFSFSGSYAAIVYVVFKLARIAISKGLEDMVHEALHIGWGIGWTKAHDS
jgi:hypothetical protein